MVLRVHIKRRALWGEIARRNISQNELAELLGISSGYMSQLLHGTRCPSPRLRREILRVLDPLSFDDLFIIQELEQPATDHDEADAREM